MNADGMSGGLMLMRDVVVAASPWSYISLQTSRRHVLAF